eukprot:CFRG0787T1
MDRCNTRVSWSLQSYFRFVQSYPRDAVIASVRGSWKKYESTAGEGSINALLSPTNHLVIASEIRVYESHNLYDPTVRLMPDTTERSVVAFHKHKSGVRISRYTFSTDHEKNQFLQTMEPYHIVTESQERSKQLDNSDSAWAWNTDSCGPKPTASINTKSQNQSRKGRASQSQLSTLSLTDECFSSEAALDVEKPKKKPKMSSSLPFKKGTNLLPSEMDTSVFLRLCLLDPCFPDFVEQIERELYAVMKAD